MAMATIPSDGLDNGYCGYIVALDQGDYLEERGGYDWGRTSRAGATTYDTRTEAEAALMRVGSAGRKIIEC